MSNVASCFCRARQRACLCRQYDTFADYFAKRYGIHGLSANCPLALARPLQHAAGSINVLLPPDSIRGTRQHGCAWLADHARDVAVLQGEEHPAVKRNHDGNGTEKEKLLSCWEVATGTRGSGWALLPLALCKAHPVGLATLRDVRMLPALLRHTEVRRHALCTMVACAGIELSTALYQIMSQ